MKNSVHQDGFSCFVKIFNFVRPSGQIQIGLMAVRGNQFECKVPTLKNWHNKSVHAWLDQGRETPCRDYVDLGILIGL